MPNKDDVKHSASALRAGSAGAVSEVHNPLVEHTSETNQHFATDHLLQNLKGRTVSSGLVTGIAQVAQFGLNLLSVVVLARLLSPRDFGLVAMVGTIMGFLRIFNDAGLSMATVQRDEITHAQVSNLFWTNIALGGFASLVLIVSAPAIAWFYREPRLVSVTLLLSMNFLMSGSAVQHMALLKRQMQFKKIAVIQIGSVAAGVLVGIGMAWQNFGYWSLVGMQLTTPLLAFVLTWFSSKWRPQWISRRSGTRPLLGFGANLTASSFIWSVARGTDAILIGRVYGSAPLGLYSRAASLVARPLDQAMAPIEAVLTPTLSRLVSQPDRYRRVALQVFEAVVVTSFLFTGLLLALARPIVLVALGPKWSEAVPIFAGFSLVALYIPIGGIAGWLVTTQGRGQEVLGGSLISSVSTVIAFLVGLSFGPGGVAVCYSIFCCVIALPTTFYIVGRRGPVSTKDLWTRLLTHLPVWIVVCATTFLARRVAGDASPLVQLLICAPAGVAAGMAAICLSSESRKVAVGVLSMLRELADKRYQLYST